MPKTRHMLVTNALPYANGPLHIGHMVEYIQTDIWVRFQRMQGHHCYYISGDDAHGTPIMLKAEQLGISPEALIEDFHQQHCRDFRDFLINFDQFSTTHCPENRDLVHLIYQRLLDRGDIARRTISQAYDPIKNMFLPDRFVKGECPKCHAQDQYGDNCEICGATYTPTDLIHPTSVVSGATPIEKESEHYFFKLENHQALLKEWIHSERLQPEVRHKLTEWLSGTLRDWDISRDAPYFGIEIPNAPGKYFYVWLDAPIGYMASFQHLIKHQPERVFSDFWGKESEHELYHFIGKDIIYFHALFWPAILEAAGFRTPTAVYAHGFLTVNGKKMSKSRGTFITARDYLTHFSPEYLRYYFAAKLSNGIEDIDLNFTDFMQRVNADLIGKIVNIASRCAGFIKKHFNNTLADTIDDDTLLHTFITASDNIAQGYAQREFSLVIRNIAELADKANQYIDSKKPWQRIKEPQEVENVHRVCTMGLNLFRVLMFYLHPILPAMTKQVERFLNCSLQHWHDRSTPLLNHTIEPFKPLMQRIEQQQIDKLLEQAVHEQP